MKDRGREWRGGGDGRERDGEREAKCERERRKERFGLVVNGCNWVRVK